MDTTYLHPIKAVAKLTGLSPHVIRIWEKRYQAVVPQRTPTNRRMYTSDDVARFNLLQRAIRTGRSISQVASMSDNELRRLVQSDAPAAESSAEQTEYVATTLSRQVDDCLKAIENLDDFELERLLNQALVTYSQPQLLEDLIIPVTKKIGDMWKDGSLRIGHEHMASAVIRTFLGNLLTTYAPKTAGPMAIVATPQGQHHELGALVVALAAAAEGWRVIYLGANLPADEIASVAIHKKAPVIALSIVFPTNDPTLHQELKRLRNLILPGTTLLVGGRGALGYTKTLNKIDAVILTELTHLRSELERLRNLCTT